MDPVVELQPNAPVVPEDGDSVPAVKVDLIARAHNAWSRSAVKPKEKDQDGTRE